MRTVVIRVDASVRMGTGHVMRCLTLADALCSQGATIRFICREHEGHWCEAIEGRGYPVHRLPAPLSTLAPDGSGETAHGAWLGLPQDQDARETAAILASYAAPVDWLVVDHYALGRPWEERLRPHARQVMAIDDLADREHACDLLLDQNYYPHAGDRYAGLVPSHCRLLLGPRYALLRSEFQAHDPQAPRDEAKRVLVFFGGTDAANETGKVLTALSRVAQPDLEIDVVLGASNPHGDSIASQAQPLGHCVVRRQVTNMAELMAKADLFVGAGGTTNWERCYFGLPSVVVTIARNQEETTEALARSGRIVYLGPAQSVTDDQVSDAIRMLLGNRYLRAAMATASRELVDGRGAHRVAQAMGGPVISLRPATRDDCDWIYAWRNAEETRRYIFNPAPLALADHRRWFENSLENPDRLILIGESEGEPIGVLRYDLEGTEAEVSIYTDPARHGRGFGTALLNAGNHWLREDGRVRTIRASIFAANVASQKAFLAAGYRAQHCVYVADLNQAD